MASGNVLYGIEVAGRARPATVAGVLNGYFGTPVSRQETRVYRKQEVSGEASVTNVDGNFRIALQAADKKLLEELVTQLSQLGLSAEGKPKIIRVTPSRIDAKV